MRQIADYANIDPVILAGIIRQVDSLQALQSRPERDLGTRPSSQPTRVQSSMLAVARDQTEKKQEAGDVASKPADQDDDREGRNDLADE